MPSPFDLKTHKNKMKNSCSLFLGKSSKDTKKCLELTMDCHMNKCKKEVEDKISSDVNEEDIKKCDEESKGDFMKSIKCNKKILKKSGFYEKNAKMGYCTANKCPEMTDLISNTVKNVGERLYKSMPNYKCVEEHCKKERDELDKQSLEQLLNICNKNYNNHKGQTKCAEKLVKIHMKLNKKYKNCKDTHCNDKKNTKKIHTKKTKSHTKKH
jgi:hypothetical protein